MKLQWFQIILSLNYIEVYSQDVDALKADIIKRINSIIGRTWTAENNRLAQGNPQLYDFLMGTIIDASIIRALRRKASSQDSSLPETFDSRTNWPDCDSIPAIRDQSSCGSCWAISSASVMSDRLCIASQGNVSVNISAQHLTSCCYECGFGCAGGYTLSAFEWYERHGIVTGGDWESFEGCQPYEIPPCLNLSSLATMICPNGMRRTPMCHDDKCTNPTYDVPFRSDLHYGLNSYVMDMDPKAIQEEIYENGPLVAAFDVYMDFLFYKDGVYQYLFGPKVGAHSVRVLGWGEEGGVPYWLAANSWGRGWGDGGLFKIRRGANECRFEEFVVGGMPRV